MRLGSSAKYPDSEEVFLMNNEARRPSAYPNLIQKHFFKGGDVLGTHFERGFYKYKMAKLVPATEPERKAWADEGRKVRERKANKGRKARKALMRNVPTQRPGASGGSDTAWFRQPTNPNYGSDGGWSGDSGGSSGGDGGGGGSGD